MRQYIPKLKDNELYVNGQYCNLQKFKKTKNREKKEFLREFFER
jgi:hypothetical protein